METTTELSAQPSLNADMPAAHIASQEEKLNALFGITGGKSIDEFLDTLKLDDSQTSVQLSTFNDQVKEKIAELDNMQIDIGSGETPVQLQMKSMEHSLEQVEELVTLSKDIIRHVAQSILATPLIDSEAVQAYSNLIECIRVSIDEFIGVYRDKLNFVNRVKMEMLKLHNAKDLLLYKHKLAVELAKAKLGPETVDAEVKSSAYVDWTQEKGVKDADDLDLPSEV